MTELRPLTHTQSALTGRQAYEDVLLNRYRIMESCGTGGFGTVLTCWDTRLQRRVAIKRLPLVGAAGASSTVSEALAEARTASMLAHANIVTVFDFEVEGPYAYLVMEYVDGLTLEELLARVEGGILTHDEAACLVQSVAAALGFAHENGVLHMDIKPSNIMIDRTGTIKLCDFGMATLASAAGFGGARGGTVGYMPPEQIEGDLVDERTDIFSLGVVTWQALLGSSPFAAPTAEKSLALIRKGAPKPSKQDIDLMGTAEDTLLAALAANPSSRIPTVENLAKLLVPALGDPTAGAKSLSGLVSQTPASTEDDLEDWEGERLPLGISYPWIPSTFTRVVSAVAALVAAWPIAEALFSHNLVLARAAALACVAITALWPPLGSALVFGGLATTIAVHSATASPLLLAIVMGSLAVAWWVRCAMESNLSTLAALMPACLSSPLAGTAIAGYALRPLPALLTACLSWIVGRIWPTLLATKFGLDGLVDALLMPLAAPPALMSMAGCAFSAVLCSAMTWRNDAVGTAIAGQALGCITLVGFQLLAARMENGGIWADPSWDNTGIAVLLSVLVCIACVLQGPRDVDVESED